MLVVVCLVFSPDKLELQRAEVTPTIRLLSPLTITLTLHTLPPYAPQG